MLFGSGEGCAPGAGVIVCGLLVFSRTHGGSRFGLGQCAGKVRLIVEDVGFASFSVAVFEAVIALIGKGIEFRDRIKAARIVGIGLAGRKIGNVVVRDFGRGCFGFRFVAR